MKIIFMGTPAFAVEALEALCRDGQEVILAVTQPDRQKGRGRNVICTPVKECAEKWNIPVFQPARIREPEAVERIRALAPDLIIVAAFGQILPQELLDIPRLGCVNIHASLLPKLRGAAPIQWAVINGEKESGITLMQMDAGLDTGDILFREAVPIDPQETGDSLYEKLARLGGEMIVRHLPAIGRGEVTPVPQREEESSYAPMLRKEMGQIDWSLPAEVIERRLRGMLPWPGAFTTLDGRVLKIWRARTVALPAAADGKLTAGPQENGPAAEDRSFAPETTRQHGPADDPSGRKAVPGTVLFTDKKAIYAATGEGTLAILEMQAEGRKRMDADAFLRGTKVPAGTVLGAGR